MTRSATSSPMEGLLHELRGVRQRGRALLVIQRLAVVLAWMAGVTIAAALIDYFLRLPSPLRIILLVAGVAWLGWTIARFVIPALRFRPSLTEVALRVERTQPALSGRLASSVEFASAGMSESNEFAARSVRDVQTRASGASLAKAIDWSRTKRNVGALLGVAALAIACLFIAPAGAQTALMRLFVPWGDAKWPARTAIESLMADGSVHPRGTALPLRVRATKAPGGRVDDMRILARYRLEVDGDASEWKEVVLTPQDHTPGLYERLVDTEADAIEFSFEALDSATSTQRIALAPPPVIISAALTMTPPEYARPYLQNVDAELGPGVDERALVETPALVGTTASLTITLNKSIPVGTDESWLRETVGWSGETLPRLGADRDSRGFASQFSLDWILRETASLRMHLVDEHGLTNEDEIAYRIVAAEDREPTVTMLVPESDQSVLASAMVPLASEARDDVALSGIGLDAVLAARTDSAGDAPLELWTAWEDIAAASSIIERELDLAPFQLKEGDVVEVTGAAQDIFAFEGRTHERTRSPARRLRVISERDFGEALFQELKSLRQNAIRLEAQQAELQDDIIDDGVQPGAQRAQERIGERLAEQLDAIRGLRERRDLNRFEDAQLDGLINQSEDLLSHAGSASNSAVEQIDQRANEQGEAQSAPEETAAAGNQQPREDAASEVAQATDDADRPEADTEQQPQPDQPANAPATEPTEGAEETPDTEESPREESTPEILDTREPAAEDRPIVEAQQEVRDELRDLIQLLDDNEDTWLMAQQIRDLLEAQTALQAETQGLAQQTMGQSPEQLDPVELSELDRIDQRQRDLAEEMRDLIDELRNRADDMEQVDPQAAQGQRSAADTAEEREVDRHMEDAARSASQNQLQNAQNSQQRAREGLERMQEDLDRKRARAAELQRRLESLIESIKRLVTVQESELAALDAAIVDIDFAGRDRAMIRLNQNTQAVSGEARAAGRETDRIARALDRAADAQGAAVTALRASPIIAADVKTAEDRSLEMLREALAAAEEMEQQAEEDMVRQQREELIKAYLELAELQAALRGDSLELAALTEFDRRALVEARMQGSRQEEIRTAVADVQLRTSEISESLVFSHVHSLIDVWADEASAQLREGVVNSEVTDRQQSIAESLTRLAQALEEEQSQPNEFEQGGQQQGGGGDGQPGQQQPDPVVPPLSELKLLRGMQEHIYNQTRSVDSRSDLEEAARRQRLRNLQREQQELQRLGEQLQEQYAPQAPPPDEQPPEGVIE